MVTKDISELHSDIMELVKDAIFHTHAVIVENTPVAQSVPSDPPYSMGHTGSRLRKSVVIEQTPEGWIIGTNVPYAEYVELGVEPHSIDPVHKKTLKFYSPKNGSFVFAGHVDHPGFAGRGMFLKGVTEFEKYMDSHLPR